MKKRFVSILVFALALCAFAEDENSLGDFDPFGDSATDDQTSNFSIALGGSLNAGGKFFFNDFKTFSDTRASSLIFGDLHVKATAPLTEAYFGVKINDMVLPFHFGGKPELYPREPQIPRWIDEAYVQASIDPVVFGGGIKKLTWGKADAFSVLDVINPQDLSDLTVSDIQKTKIARPMLYLSAYLPKEMKLDFVFLPIFEGNTFALSGRWKSNQFEKMQTNLFKEAGTDIVTRYMMAGKSQMEAMNNMMQFYEKMNNGTLPIANNFPTEIDSAKLKYAQAGIRYTATIAGMHDVGFQYFYGRLPNPALTVDGDALFAMIDAGKEADQTTPAGQQKLMQAMKAAQKAFTMDYNPYHQIGIDYALALGPINVRTEFAANITYDLKGDKPNVYNPSLAWNAGIDYTTPIGLSINVCASENIKLMHNKIGTKLYDIEKGSKVTDTKIMLLLSKPLLRDSMNLKLRTVMAAETLDFFMVPSFDWTFGTFFLNIEAGFFFGKKDGTFSQFKDNNYIGLSIGYTF